MTIVRRAILVALGLCSVGLSESSSPVKADLSAEVLKQRFEAPKDGDVGSGLAKDFFKKYKYPYDTTEQIMAATKSANPGVRRGALHLLAVRMGQKSIPVLREALKDEWLGVRGKATSLLAGFGDGSGLLVMQRDFERLTKAIDRRKTDPNSPGDPNDRVGVFKVLNRTATDLTDAMTVAGILARAGDNRGFELAVEMLQTKDRPFLRLRAVDTLGTIAKWSSPSVLAAEKRDPEGVLLRVAESETDHSVLHELTIWAVASKNEDFKDKVLAKVQVSPYAEDYTRESARVVRAQLERQRARSR
jgi:HEAT repeat protein